VKVTEAAGDPGIRAAESLVVSTVGATRAAVLKPIPPTNVATAPLPAFGAGLETVTLHVPEPAVWTNTTVIEFALFQVVPVTDETLEHPGNVTVAPDWNPDPLMTTLSV
jgi:hypothetical protein